MKEKAPLPQCSEISRWAREDVPEFVHEARYHLSLAQGPNQFSSWAGHGDTEVNRKLNPLGTYRVNGWSELTAQEQVESEKVLNKYISEIWDESKRRAASGRLKPRDENPFRQKALLIARYQHFQKYNQSASQFLFMQHLKSAEPDESEIVRAAETLSAQLKKEREYLALQKQKIAASEASGKMASKLYELMNYSFQVEQVLDEAPEYCGLASSIAFSSRDSSHRMLAAALPIMAASFFITPWIMVPLGVGVGLHSVDESQKLYRIADRRVQTQVYSDPTSDDSAAAEMARKQRNFDILTLPIGYGLAGMAGRAIKAPASTIQWAASLPQRAKTFKTNAEFSRVLEALRRPIRPE